MSESAVFERLAETTTTQAQPQQQGSEESGDPAETDSDGTTDPDSDGTTDPDSGESLDGDD